MNRDKFTNHLIKIVGIIESDTLPVHVKSLYVFGSYARGALEPNDLDLVLIFEQSQQEWLELLERAKMMYPNELYAGYKLREGTIRKAFARPGMSVDLHMDNAFPPAIAGEGGTVKVEELKLLWSQEDHDWRSKLDAITTNPEARRAERNHLIELKRTRSTLKEMDVVVKMVEARALTCTPLKIDLATLPKLNRYHQQKLDWYSESAIYGREVLKCMPFVFSWFERCGSKYEYHTRNMFFDRKRQCYLFVGKPPIYAAYGYLKDANVKRVAMLPFIKKGKTNELLDFSRGPNWQAYIEQLPSYER